MSRLSRWENERRFAPYFINLDDTFSEVMDERVQRRSSDKPFSFRMNWVQSAKELIFDVDENGRPVVHAVNHAIDAETLEIVTTPMLTQIDADDDDIKVTLAVSIIEDVPVYPNTDEIAPILERYMRDVMISGFGVEEAGERAHFVLRRYESINLDAAESLTDFSAQEMLSPAELLLVRAAVQREMEERDEAGRLLASLRAGIQELGELLQAQTANEGALQACLTQSPLLFGLDYHRVIPQHRLGAEYVMDYALERISGFVDLVEIEASTHPLYTQQHKPTAALVKAEQQVLDWLDWIDLNAAYARQTLPGVQRPMGYVIIGRSSSLSEEDSHRLRRRNTAFQGSVQVLTYNDLLGRAQMMLDRLQGTAAGTDVA